MLIRHRPPASLNLYCTCALTWHLILGLGHAEVQTISTAGRNVYCLTTAATGTAHGNRLIVGSTYDNRVCAFTTAGLHLWDADVGGFVFDLAAGDLDGDAGDEILAAAADGWVYVFASDGELRWKRDLGAPVYQVAVAKLDGRSPVVLASGVSRELVAFSAGGGQLAAAQLNGAGRMMRAGDFDGDGADEVAVMPIRGQAKDMVFFEGPILTRLKETISSNSIPWDPVTRRSKDTGEAFRRGKHNWDGLSLKKANGTVVDLDRDGSADLLYPPGAYTLRSGLRELFVLPETFKAASYDYHYNMRLLAAGDLAESPGAEIVVAEGPAVRLYDASGRELGKATAPLGFTSVAYLPGSPHGSVVLGSSPNGDDNLYRLSFEPGWENSLGSLERAGTMARIGANLKQVADAAAAWRGEPMEGADGPCDVVVSHHFWSGADLKKLDGWIAEVRDYERQFPYSRLRFATAFWPGENAPLIRPDGKPWGRDRRLAHDLTRDQIVAGAKRFEEARCHFWVQVGHGCDPHLEIATVAAMLDAAPTMLRGFISAEDEQLEDVRYYFEHHIQPILELCLKHGKRFIPRNKDVWWAHWPADAKMREMIFNGRYRSVLLPSVEDSNSRSAEVNLAARVGLWLDGQVDDWASRCSADWFCASRAWEWEYGMTGHPQLRYYVSQALLGARVFMMLNGERQPRTGEWTRVGSEGTASFLHLLGKGVLTPPRREQLQAVSPVALVMQQPSERFIHHGSNGHHEEGWGGDGSDAQPWPFDRLDAYWAMAPLPPTDVATYLWHRTRRDASHVPVTAPHGFVCLVPGAVSGRNNPWLSVWTTDGDTLARHGKRCSLNEARRLLEHDLAAGEKRFPFQVEGRVFHQVVRQSLGRYVIALVDPGWLDPADRDIVIRTELPGTWTATDRLTGQPLGAIQNGLEISVPAGAIKLLQLQGDMP
jgi:hypothetical protein